MRFAGVYGSHVETWKEDLALITLRWSTETGRQTDEYMHQHTQKLCHTPVNTEKEPLFSL